jgi:peptide/nickel transport system substrate-binding protein
MALALTLTLSVAGYNGAKAAGVLSRPSAANDTLVIVTAGTPNGIDLDRQANSESWILAPQVYAQGMEWQRGPDPYPSVAGINNHLVPGYTYPQFKQEKTVQGIIQSCTLSRDGKTALYHLRHNVRAWNGDEFTSADVIYRVQRAIGNKAIGDFIANAANAGTISQWHIVDKYTVKITNSTPMPLICVVNTNSYWHYYDSKVVKAHATPSDPWANTWLSTHDAGYGPYHITSWKAGDEIDMVANTHYWQGAPSIKRVIYKIVPDASSRIALLESGRAQIAEALSPQDIISLKGKPGVHPVAVHGNESMLLEMNNATPPFNNVKVRRAIEYAIPRDTIVRDVYRGLAFPWEGVMPSVYPGYINFNGHYPYDLAKAKQLLAAAGYKNGLTVPLIYSAADPVQEDLAITLRTSFQKLGLNVVFQKLPLAAYADAVQSKKATFALWIDFPIQPDPNYSMRLFYLTGNAVNYQNYHNPEVDRILQQGVSIVDPAQRNQFNGRAEPIIENDATLGWVCEPAFTIALSSRVHGWGWYTTQYYRVYDLSLH